MRVRHRYHYIRPVTHGAAISPPPPGQIELCVRIATNQHGTPDQITQPNIISDPTSGQIWRGADSFATGTLESWAYEQTGSNPDTFQQFMIFSSLTGLFLNNEVLQVKVAGVFQDSGIKTRSAADGGTVQLVVDCDSGNPILPPGGGTNGSGGGDTGVIVCKSTVFCQAGIGLAYNDDLVYALNTRADYSAVAVTTPAKVTGVISGAYGQFEYWNAVGPTPQVILSMIHAGPFGVGFLGGEQFIITDASGELGSTLYFGNPTELTEV